MMTATCSRCEKEANIHDSITKMNFCSRVCLNHTLGIKHSIDAIEDRLKFIKTLPTFNATEVFELNMDLLRLKRKI